MVIKKRLRQLLQQQDYDEIADLAAQRHRVLGTLLSLMFDRDPLIGWRAVEATGAAAERIAQTDPDVVRDHLRRLHWLISEESGGICWRAPEALAEIVRRSPSLFPDYTPIVLYLIREMAEEDLLHFRAGILWAIGRLGPICAGPGKGDKSNLCEAPSGPLRGELDLSPFPGHGRLFDEVLPDVLACLDHPDSQVRGMAAWCLGQCGRADGLAGRDDLLADEAPVDLYEGGQLARTSVGRLVRRALAPGSAEDRPTRE